MKKKIITMLLATIVLLSSPIVGSAQESSTKAQPKKMSQKVETSFDRFVGFVEKNLKIENDRYVLKNVDNVRAYIQSDFTNISKILNVDTPNKAIKVLKERFEDLNNKADTGKIAIFSDGSYYSGNMIFDRSSDHDVSTHWWGVRHAFYSSSAARSFASEIDGVSDLAAAAATLFPGSVSSLVGTLTSWYLTVLAKDIRYWADDTDHFNTDIAWTLNYRMYEN